MKATVENVSGFPMYNGKSVTVELTGEEAAELAGFIGNLVTAQGCITGRLYQCLIGCANRHEMFNDSAYQMGKQQATSLSR